MTLLFLKNLSVSNENTKILNNLNLSIGKKEIHVIMGPNGSGKSTLAKIIAGDSNYTLTAGDIFFRGKNLKMYSPEERAKLGIFLAFQSPVEINNLKLFDFLYLLYTERKLRKNQKLLSPIEFLPLIKTLLKKVDLKEEFLNRNFNDGFSGGEKKKNEILQILLLKPKLIILDEIDSGLDIDALKNVCKIFKNMNSAFLIITHNPNVIRLVEPNFIHIFFQGKIQKTGNKNLVEEVEQKGYNSFNS